MVPFFVESAARSGWLMTHASADFHELTEEPVILDSVTYERLWDVSLELYGRRGDDHTDHRGPCRRSVDACHLPCIQRLEQRFGTLSA